MWGNIMLFKEEADSCRRQANEYIGRPEAPFLLNVARAFDELAINNHSSASAPLAHREVTQFIPRVEA